MRIVFMGTPDFSVPALQSIIENGHEVVAVVTQPDKPKGRGKAVLFPPVKERALEHNIPVYQPVKVREESYVNILKELKPDAIVVVAFGQILPKNILEIPKYGCINIHASLLPKYRGAAPIHWSIINGEVETGVTTMLMDVGLDTGDMLLREVCKIEKKETAGSLHDKLSEIGSKLIIETLKGLEAGTIKAEKQDDSQSTYVKTIEKSLGKIDFSKSAKAIECQIRGLNPWPSAYTYLDGKMLKIWDADVMDSSTVDFDVDGSDGTILSVEKNGILVKTGEGILTLKEIQLEGKKRMEVESFLRGYTIEKGICFQ